MVNTIPLSDEKDELHAVLSSETFLKSPNLSKLLAYICNKYFEGCAGDLKEYNIGVEAMGRPANFDPTANSIVRVDAHRLREKLKKYYESEGADHALIITLQLGHYVPQFIRRPGRPTMEVGSPDGAGNSKAPAPNDGPPAELNHPAFSEPVGSFQAPNSHLSGPLIRLGGLLGIIVATSVIILGVFIAWKGGVLGQKVDRPNPDRNDEKFNQAAHHDDLSVRILSGYYKESHIDRSGKLWESDRYFTGGRADSRPRRFIARTLDPTLYETFRLGDFSYNIPLKPGVYELRLYFSEPIFGPDTYDGGGESSRIFSVEINGRVMIDDLDVVRGAGGNNTSYIRVFKDVKPGPDSYLHLKFDHTKADAILNALEVLPGTTGKMNPIRIVAQDSSYTDREGRVWSPDSYFLGGQLIHHKGPDTGTPDPDIYSGERFGSFSYALPVPPGKYKVTLRFAETYFGPGNPGGGGARSRVFDVYTNGEAILRHFDIFAEAGGANRALDKTFRALEPNAQGNILLTFAPVRNYACVNAIEVVDESQ